MVRRRTVLSFVLLGLLLSVLTVHECFSRKIIVYEKRFPRGAHSTPRDAYGGRSHQRYSLALIVRLISDDDNFTKEELKSLKPDKKAAKKAVEKCMEQEAVEEQLKRRAYGKFQEVLERCLEPSTPRGYKYESRFRREIIVFD